MTESDFFITKFNLISKTKFKTNYYRPPIIRAISVIIKHLSAFNSVSPIDLY